MDDMETYIISHTDSKGSRGSYGVRAPLGMALYAIWKSQKHLFNQGDHVVIEGVDGKKASFVKESDVCEQLVQDSVFKRKNQYKYIPEKKDDVNGKDKK